MQPRDPKIAAQFLELMLQPWRKAVENPLDAQQRVLKKNIEIYKQTTYGRRHLTTEINDIDSYRRAFPVISYKDVKPMVQQVMAGDFKLLCDESPLGWAITRGTTGDESKFIPMTPADMQLRSSAGRAMMNFVLSQQKFAMFNGVNLNLNFPSTIGTVKVGDRDIEYGYSSGIYVKHVSQFTPIRSVPTQAEIDELGGGKTVRDWEARFELAYQKCKDQDVTMVGGVAPTAISFGKYLKRAHGVYPKNIWKVQIMTLGSVAGINTRYEPALRAMYGDVAIREIYGATEGMFGQQRDTLRAWVPNYDLFFFEIQVGQQIKMLHEMKSGEIGSLIVSTPVLPRYKIGDLIR
ncbi:MAG TPA: GH3 auxin-responsive promoter family protein, partial [Dehalococcoidales bacterium]|nr:GH3 auxin-responsive promoter family protein [Dehalococcoidales bacterium]